MTKVLYVEDNDDNVFMLKMRLELLGDFEVLKAEDGEKGCAMAVSEGPISSYEMHYVMAYEMDFEITPAVQRSNCQLSRNIIKSRVSHPVRYREPLFRGSTSKYLVDLQVDHSPLTMHIICNRFRRSPGEVRTTAPNPLG